MSITKHYRETNYGDLYTVTYKQTNGIWTMDCPQHPRDRHGKPVREHHLYPSGRICVAEGHEPRTFDRAQAIVAAWIDGYSEYVRTGTFPKRERTYNV